jgi:hypothetical protein
LELKHAINFVFMFSLYMICVFRRLLFDGVYQRYFTPQRWQLHRIEKKIDLAFVLAEVDWVVTTPCPNEPVAPMRETNESDAEWQKKERDHAPIQMAYDLQK